MAAVPGSTVSLPSAPRMLRAFPGAEADLLRLSLLHFIDCPAEFPAASLGKTQLPVGTVSVCLPLYLASQSATSYDGLSSVMPVNHGVPENVKKSASVKLTEAAQMRKKFDLYRGYSTMEDFGL